jgi:hypothetical protein
VKVVWIFLLKDVNDLLLIWKKAVYLWCEIIVDYYIFNNLKKSLKNGLKIWWIKINFISLHQN